VDLYIIRHAIAEERDSSRWPDDSQRPLTDRGRQRFRPVAQLLGRMCPDLDMLLSSGYVRAWETAELLARFTDWPDPQRCAELEGASCPQVCAALQGQSSAESLAIVGHDPSFSDLVSHLLAGSDLAIRIDFKKGGAVCLNFDGPPQAGAATLAWYLTPRLARRLSE